MIETPKNLTKNILLGMLFGFIVGASFYYLEFLPQGFNFFLFIIKEVINKLNIDLKNTNSYIGILLSIFFTQTVIRLKKNEANNKFSFFNELLF